MKAVDTNVVYYSLDTSEQLKQPLAKSLLINLAVEAETLLPWQVACEFLGLLRRRMRQRQMTSAGVEDTLQDLLQSFPVIWPKASVFDRSITLFARYSLSHWDSLLHAACLEAGVTTLYSEDLGHNVVYDGLTVINPFAD
jgi:predicted nucleic acid-binding protein